MLSDRDCGADIGERSPTPSLAGTLYSGEQIESAIKIASGGAWGWGGSVAECGGNVSLGMYSLVGGLT